MKSITREYNYSDINLVPNKCIVNSRSECSTEVKLGKHKFSLPIIPANMKSVINQKSCEYFASKNMFYIMHRFDVDQLAFISSMKSKNYITSISVGVNEESYNQLKDIKNSKLDPDFITVDIAYVYAPKGEKIIKYIKDNFPNTFLIAGNMTTAEAVNEVTSWGADCCKLFVGPGKACTTRVMTGMTRPCVSTLLECSSMSKVPLIADGGISEPGDIAKAIACGAHMVMIGSLLSGFDQSSSEFIEIDGHKKAVYFGSASSDNKNNSATHIEGKKVLLDYKGDMTPYLQSLSESLKSSISYAGGKDLSALSNCKIVSIN